MPSEPTITLLSDSETQLIQKWETLGHRVLKFYDITSETITSSVLDQAFLRWRNGPKENVPSANDIVNGLGVLFGLCFVPRSDFRWCVVTDASGTSLSLQHIASGWLFNVRDMVAKRLGEQDAFFDG